MLQATSKEAIVAAFGTTPRTAVSFGTQVPHVGSLSRVHSKPVAVTVEESTVQRDYANSTE
jgi:hypothetical protein